MWVYYTMSNTQKKDKANLIFDVKLFNVFRLKCCFWVGAIFIICWLAIENAEYENNNWADNGNYLKQNPPSRTTGVMKSSNKSRQARDE